MFYIISTTLRLFVFSLFIWLSLSYNRSYVNEKRDKAICSTGLKLQGNIQNNQKAISHQMVNQYDDTALV